MNKKVKSIKWVRWWLEVVTENSGKSANFSSLTGQSNSNTM
jgi:hypothetical protein